jgi:hypothetical protein
MWSLPLVFWSLLVLGALLELFWRRFRPTKSVVGSHVLIVGGSSGRAMGRRRLNRQLVLMRMACRNWKVSCEKDGDERSPCYHVDIAFDR